MTRTDIAEPVAGRGAHDWVRATLATSFGAVSQYLGAALAVTVFAHLDPAAMAWLRNCAAALILLIAIRPRLTGITPRRLGLAGGLGVSVLAMNALLYEAIARIPMGTASAIEFCGPVLLTAARARNRYAVAAVIAAAAGVACVTGIGPTHNATGLLFAAGAAIAFTAKAIFASLVAHSDNRRDDLALGLALSSLLALPVFLTSSSVRVAPALAGPILLIAICSSVVPYLMDQLVARRVRVDGLALLSGLLPVIAALLGFVLLGQRLGIVEWGGISLVCFAVALRAWDRTD